MNYQDLTSYILDIKKQIDSELSYFYDQRIADAALLSSEYKKLVSDTAKQTLRGGKRLRPALAVLGYRIAGGTDDVKIIKAAAALEIFHNYLLIHDDIMDRDDRRHGGANISGLYKKRLAKSLSEPEAQHVADSFSILAGDINCGLSYEALLAAGFSNDLTLQATARLNKAVFEVAAGQHLDVLGSYAKKLSLQNIIAISQHKTADYSVIMPLQFGAILAGVKNGLLESMSNYGQPLGIGFQLTDDVLGMFGNQKNTGKPILSDLHEGKQTVLMHYGIQLASPKQKKTLSYIVGNPRANLADLKVARQILEENGAKAKTLIIAQQYSKKAISFVPAITKEEQLQKLLIDFADYCVARSS
ncbi:polyprenyl synthetase family protein [Candidatus Saccharibacteria bacterium]|nr:polyprenyl synthetase family protein [Candidatus Saccharibacteria bacterium]